MRPLKRVPTQYHRNASAQIQNGSIEPNNREDLAVRMTALQAPVNELLAEVRRLGSEISAQTSMRVKEGPCSAAQDDGGDGGTETFLQPGRLNFIGIDDTAKLGANP